MLKLIPLEYFIIGRVNNETDENLKLKITYPLIVLDSHL